MLSSAWLLKQPQRCHDGISHPCWCQSHDIQRHLCSISPGTPCWVPSPGRGQGAATLQLCLCNPPITASLTSSFSPSHGAQEPVYCKGRLWHFRPEWIRDLDCNPRLLQSTALVFRSAGISSMTFRWRWCLQPTSREQPSLQQERHQWFLRGNTQKSKHSWPKGAHTYLKAATNAVWVFLFSF